MQRSEYSVDTCLKIAALQRNAETAKQFASEVKHAYQTIQLK
jgi:hypothetical protein